MDTAAFIANLAPAAAVLGGALAAYATVIALHKRRKPRLKKEAQPTSTP